MESNTVATRVAEHSVRINTMERSIDKLSETLDKVTEDLRTGTAKLERKLTWLAALLIASNAFGDSVSSLVMRLLM